MKHIARLTGANARTVQKWLQARNDPSGAALMVLMWHSDEVTKAVLALAERDGLTRASARVRNAAGMGVAINSHFALLPES